MSAPLSSRDRVLRAVGRKGIDRLPVKHEAAWEVNHTLIQHFGVGNYDELQGVIGNDFRFVSPRYIGPELKRFPDGRWEGPWGEIWHNVQGEAGRIYAETIHLPYADMEDPSELDRSRFPSADYYDFSGIRAECEKYKGFAIGYGDPAHIELINGVARIRGIEQVLMDLACEEPVYLELAEARFRFYYHVVERALEAAGGLIDVVHCGQDLGTQSGPLMSMQTFEAIFAPRLKEFFEMVHRHGALVMMHSCGSVRAFIPRLIELGLDILDVVQVTAEGMQLEGLARDFGKDLCFAGSMCVQTVLPKGSVSEIRDEVAKRRRLFPEGGLIIGPTHMMQVDTPVENVLSMYREAGSLTKR